MIVPIPMPPWSKWFSGVMELLPRGVSLSVVVFICSIALKFASLLSVSYPDLSWKHKLVFYLLGMLGCAFSLLRLFAADTKRRMAGCLPGFFLSLVLVSLGVSRTGLVLSAYFACIFVPVFTGLILCAWAMEIRGALPRLFAALLFALVWGLPGTPVYQIFSGIGARSLELGIGYTIVFGLLWFFYFNANIHIYRRILLLGEGGSPEDADPIASLAPRLFAGYGLFLMLLVILVAQIAGRIL